MINTVDQIFIFILCKAQGSWDPMVRERSLVSNGCGSIPRKNTSGVSEGTALYLYRCFVTGSHSSSCSSVLFLSVAHSLPLTFELKLAAGCFFVGEETLNFHTLNEFVHINTPLCGRGQVCVSLVGHCPPSLGVRSSWFFPACSPPVAEPTWCCLSCRCSTQVSTTQLKVSKSDKNWV